MTPVSKEPTVGPSKGDVNPLKIRHNMSNKSRYLLSWAPVGTVFEFADNRGVYFLKLSESDTGNLLVLNLHTYEVGWDIDANIYSKNATLEIEG